MGSWWRVVRPSTVEFRGFQATRRVTPAWRSSATNLAASWPLSAATICGRVDARVAFDRFSARKSTQALRRCLAMRRDRRRHLARPSGCISPQDGSSMPRPTNQGESRLCCICSVNCRTERRGNRIWITPTRSSRSGAVGGRPKSIWSPSTRDPGWSAPWWSHAHHPPPLPRRGGIMFHKPRRGPLCFSTWSRRPQTDADRGCTASSRTVTQLARCIQSPAKYAA